MKLTNQAFEHLFHQLFLQSENTQLVNGLDIGRSEPLYKPASSKKPAQIIYAHGYLSSAFHEVAHWCYAGQSRRQLEDYGYWYLGDSRNQAQQADFEAVELMPQAYEYILCQAAGMKFQVSLDNFNQSVVLDRDGFFDRVLTAANQKRRKGLSPRLARLVQALEQLKYK